MDTPTLRILDTLTSHLGEPLSINQLTERVKDKHGTAYYANIYKKLQKLKNEGLLTIEFCGNSSIIKPNFRNYLLIDSLAEMEIEKKINFLKRRTELTTILSNMNKLLNNMCSIKSISAINAAKNIGLNRIELLFILRKSIGDKNATIKLYENMSQLQDKYNLRIDSLILNEDDFSALIRSDDINPLREAIAKQTTFFCPEAFWNEIKEIAEETEIKTITTETKPDKISEDAIVYNLSRFGYKEFGPTILQTNKYCIEYIITALLLSNDARRIEAIPIILAKNEFKSNLLAFLSQKYRITSKLLGLLKILQSIKPNNRITGTISILETFDEEETPADEQSILRKMRLYNVIK